MTGDLEPRTEDPIAPAQLTLLSHHLGALAQGRGAGVQVTSVTPLRRSVFRLHLEGATTASAVVKRLRPRVAELERHLTDRWLPAAGLDGLGPPRLAAVAEADGGYVWHVYDDLGTWGLDRDEVALAAIDVAMGGLADLHTSFAGHPLLAEPRFAAGDLGVYFYVNSVRGAARCLEALGPSAATMSADDREVRDTVEELLSGLMRDEPRRVDLLRHAGPETVVHGDLTRANVFVIPRSGTLRLRLIDWDHVGVGPAAFDVSTHIACYAPEWRPVVLERYLGAMADRGHPFPADLEWDLLVATFEAGRLANQIIWLVHGILEGSGRSFAHLAEWAAALAAVVGPGPGHVTVRGGA